MFAAKPAHAHEGDCCDHDAGAGKPEDKACCQIEGACDDGKCEKDCDCKREQAE